MGHRFSLFLSSLLIVPFISSGVLAKPAPDKEIQEIKTLYASINSLDLSTSTVLVEGLSNEGGTMDVYRDGQGKVRKLIVILTGETGRWKGEYYLENEELRFVFEKRERYNQHIMEPGEIKVIRTKEDRCYLSRNTLIQWIDSEKKKVPSNTEEFRAKQKDIIETFQVLKKRWSRDLDSGTTN